ncbi:MAG: DNA-protecting protein DprA [Pseudomonadales bacterium]|nr:DNA-protecting protein DprA [Pseudomonadales bacterium]
MEATTTHSYLALLHDAQVSPALFGRLLAKFDSIAGIRNQSLTELLSQGLNKTQAEVFKRRRLYLKSGKTASLLAKWADNPKNSIILFESPDYPNRLRHIPVPPPLLFARGNLSILHTPTLAIVGSRRSSSYGNRTSLWMAHELARLGLTICSGLAQGIDGEAHRGALQAQGNTIAVVATGLDSVYPAVHKTLSEQIAEDGLLLSEFPMNTSPRRENFPRRNRIISGLSLGVLVVEANLRSGSLITARQALEQNRDVFVVPGQINSEQSRGCHWLIKQGAPLVESPEEILESYPELGLVKPDVQDFEKTKEPGNKGINKIQQAILETIGTDQVLLDYLLKETGIPMARLATELMTLEIEGIISAQGGRYFRSLNEI